MEKQDAQSTLIARCPGKLRREVEAIARRRGVPLTEVIIEAVQHYVADPVEPVGGTHRKVDRRSRSWLTQ